MIIYVIITYKKLHSIYIWKKLAKSVEKNRAILLSDNFDLNYLEVINEKPYA